MDNATTAERFVKNDARNERRYIEAFAEDRGVRIRECVRGLAADDDGAMQPFDADVGDILLTPQDAYALGQYLQEAASLKEAQPTYIEIWIDRGRFQVPDDSMSGADLRYLHTPSLGRNVDLYFKSRNPNEPDLLVDPHTQYRLRNGDRLYTVPSNINAG